MSKYTTELRFICETESGYFSKQGYKTIDEIIELSRPKIFSFKYPIFDDEYKPVLETKIIKHYYTREICAETYGRWKLFLDDEMNLIMPYYNQLYKSALLEFDPLHDVDLTINRSKETSGDNISNSNTSQAGAKKQTSNVNIDSNVTDETNGKETERYSDTPQGGLNGIESNNYLTNVTITDTNNTSIRNSNTKNTGNIDENTNANMQANASGNYRDTETYIEKLTGKNVGSSFSKLLLEYRDTLINIDKQIIEELGELFINLW